MYYKTIYHTLSDGTKAKFTIRDRMINGKKYFYATVINTELDSYKNKSTTEQEQTYGIEITDGKQNSINYSDPDKLIGDILSKYGREWLQTEI